MNFRSSVPNGKIIYFEKVRAFELECARTAVCPRQRPRLQRPKHMSELCKIDMAMMKDDISHEEYRSKLANALTLP